MNTSSSSDKPGRRGSASASRRAQRTIDLKANAADEKATDAKGPSAGKEGTGTDARAKHSAAKSGAKAASARTDFIGDRLAALSGSANRLKEAAAGRTGGSAAPYLRAAMFALAALFGGLVALGGFSLFSPGDTQTGFAEFEARIGELSERLDGQGLRSEQLASRITDQGGVIESLAARLSEAEEGASRAATPEIRLTEFDARLSELEAVFGRLEDGQGVGSADPAGMEAAARKLAELENRVATAETQLANSVANDGGLPQVQLERIADVAERANANRADVEDLGGRFGDLEIRIAALSARLDEFAEQEAGQDRADERMARRMAAQALRSAYSSGRPFAQLLETAQSLAGDRAGAAALRPFAERGVATVGSLQREFEKIAPDIIAASLPPVEGIVSQLMQSARSLVTIRPSGPAEGDTPQAKVWRIGDRLEEGDLQAALSAWQALPAPARAASGDWGNELRNRVEADAALAGLLAALGGEN